MFKLTGEVIKGKQKGREIGFPTANVKLDSYIPTGIYAGEVFFNKKRYRAAVFIGYKHNLEAYLFDFSGGGLYGKTIEIRLGKKIREKIKFKNDEALKNEIEKDIKTIKSLEDVYRNN